MRAWGTSLLLALLVMTLAVGGVEAKDPNKKRNAEALRFAANNSLFVLYHEVAHLLVDQLQLPVLGKEEDAADNVATWMLLNKGTPEANQALADAANGWVLSGIAYNSEPDDSDYYAAHSLDRQRAFQIVCLMVGSDDRAFKPIANEYALDRDRQDSCHWDYALVDRSLKGLIGPRAAKSNQHGVEVEVTYHDVSGRLKSAADAFRASGVFDQVAEDLRSKFSLKTPVAFNAKRCGEANAFYDPDTVEVIFCYELMQDYLDLHASGISDSIVPAMPRPAGSGRAGSASS